ncbi:MAG: hypothetical protein IPJ00_17405 [Saprospirales bacterium]|nr:hypothetical protein [Saprospirales bacterium]
MKSPLTPSEIRNAQLSGLEAAIVGAICANPRRFREVRDIVRPEMFTSPEGRVIAPILWGYITQVGVEQYSRAVFDAKLPAELLPAVYAAMKSAANSALLSKDGEPGIIDAAELLAANWQDSEYRSAFEALAMAGFSGWQEADQVLNDVKARIVGRAITTPGDALDTLWQEIINGLAGLKKYTGISSGLSALDAITGGWQPGDQVVIGGRPGMGKTRFALAQCLEAAKAGIPAVYYSQEMNRASLYRTAFAWITGIAVMQIKGLDLNVDEADQIAAARDLLKAWPFYIVDDVFTIEDLNYSLLDYKDRHGVQLFAVDYIQQYRSKNTKKSHNTNDEIEAISRTLKQLAMKTGAVGLILSQLSREVEKRTDKRPNLADLRSSGAIEQDADFVLFPFRPEYYDPETTEGQEIDVAKHRTGEKGVVQVTWKNPGFYYPAEPIEPASFDPSMGGKVKPAQLITKTVTLNDDDEIPF